MTVVFKLAGQTADNKQVFEPVTDQSIPPEVVPGQKGERHNNSRVEADDFGVLRPKALAWLSFLYGSAANDGRRR